jgi:hypothetical protein
LNLLKTVLISLEFPTFEKLKWNFFYTTLSLRLKLFGIKKTIKSRFN